MSGPITPRRDSQIDPRHHENTAVAAISQTALEALIAPECPENSECLKKIPRNEQERVVVQHHQRVGEALHPIQLDYSNFEHVNGIDATGRIPCLMVVP